MRNGLDFSVVDVETTGLFPNGTDRIVEVAVLKLSSTGEQIDSFSTLVNPGRDIGPTHIHGIHAGDVLGAPTLEEIAGDVLGLLAGTIVVGHNVSFDVRFMTAEMARIGLRLPDVHCLCTLSLSRRVFPDLPGRKLGVICDCLGIPLPSAHSALGDAEATACLFRECLHSLRPEELRVGSSDSSRLDWPDLPKSGRTHTRSDAARSRKEGESFLARLIKRLPPSGSAEHEEDAYCELLDRVLEDRRVTPEELEELTTSALGLEVPREQVARIHKDYLFHLVRTALADGVVTEAEEADLAEVRRLLCVSEGDFEALCGEARDAHERGEPMPCEALGEERSLAGLSVCFTGALGCHVDGERATRSFAEQVASEHGMVVNKSVTKKLDMLVVADPDTLSGKGRKARQYGIRIVAEPVFWRMTGVSVN